VRAAPIILATGSRGEALLNYFGHARVATAHAEDPLLALGAMLPDFASMLRERLADLGHARLREGAALHHASDAAFHAAPEFVAQVAASSAWLRAHGVARGPARAAAHVGIELCIDVELARARDVAQLYTAALDAAADPEIERAIAWRADGAAPRWRELRLRLCARGAPDPDTRPALLAQGVARALADRPRLALDAGARTQVAAWLAQNAPALRNLAAPLLARVIRATRTHSSETP
jgi:hypothetical protein